VARDGTIYDIVEFFVDAGNNSQDDDFLQKRSAAGRLLAEVPIEGGANLAVAGDGSLIAGVGAPTALLKFDARLRARAIARIGGCGPSSFDLIAGVAADAQGNLYVGDTLHNNVHKLSPSGKPLALWGGCAS
jgi:hypothetical protein